MKNKYLTKIVLAIIFMSAAAKASTFIMNEKEYGNLQGGSVVVKDSKGDETVVSIYHNSPKGFANNYSCQNKELCYSYDTYFIELYKKSEPYQVSVVEVMNYDADIDLRLSSRARQFPVTRATSGAFNVIGLAADLLVSPFIWAHNICQRTTDDGCAYKALKFMRDQSRKGQQVPVSEQCLAHLISNIEG